MKTYNIFSVAASNVGNVRDNNEDNFFLNGKTLDLASTGTSIKMDESDSGLFAVCDGMGGEASGEVASAIAVSTLREFYQQMFEQNMPFHTLADSYANEL